jgi:hypothetical protein
MMARRCNAEHKLPGNKRRLSISGVAWGNYDTENATQTS